MNSVETWLYLLLPRSSSCVVSEDEIFQNSECGSLSLILTSVMEKQNLYLWNLESVGLCYCKWIHVVVTFKVHSNCFKTIKIQMSYLFIYTLQQEMKLQTWCSSGSGILPGSWGTGQSVPGCREITCSQRLRTGRKKEGRIFWRKALCGITQYELCMDWTGMVLGWQKIAGVKGIFAKDAFIAQGLAEEQGLVLPQGTNRMSWWDGCTEGVTLLVGVLQWSPVCVSDPVPGHWQPALPGLLSSKHCNVSSLGPAPAVLSCQKLQPWIFQSFLSGWAESGELDCSGRTWIPFWQDGASHGFPKVWPPISHITSAFPKAGLILGDSPAQHQRS